MNSNSVHNKIYLLAGKPIKITAGRLKDYEVHDLPNWTTTDDTITYYKNCYTWLQDERKTAPQDTWIQNQLDEVAQLLGQTLYRLTLK